MSVNQKTIICPILNRNMINCDIVVYLKEAKTAATNQFSLTEPGHVSPTISDGDEPVEAINKAIPVLEIHLMTAVNCQTVSWKPAPFSHHL